MTMAAGSSVKRIALIGNSPPRLCGIATFTADVRRALIATYPELAVDLFAMNDHDGNHAYGPEVVCALEQDDVNDYVQSARLINERGADVVLVQHEYGIFGGPAGSLLMKLLDRVDAPVIVVLHTVLEAPNAEQRAVIDALAARAAKLIVMAEKGRDILARVHGITGSRIAVVPHGVPDRAPVDPVVFKRRFGYEGRKVLLTFGLLSPNKGLETMIRALPAIVAAHPETLYVVLGATHPHLIAREGEAYRESLKALATDLGVSSAVRFVDGFLEQTMLLDYIQSSDIYVTPYLNEAQITSGTLSYAVALGKPVVSTPFWHASELLADEVGVLVPFGDVRQFAENIIGLLDDPARIARIGAHAYQVGRSMTWEKLAHAYMEICEDAVARQPVRLPVGPRVDAPLAHAPRFEAVERMTDSCGMVQHSIYAVPDRNHGYCVDDNCRALMLMNRIDEDHARADGLSTIYASFVQHAWNGERGRFRNFMGFDRQWLEAEGSEDSFGRSVWAIGTTASEARLASLRQWSMHLFDQVAPHALVLNSPRTWAFALLGAEGVLRAHPDHALARRLVEDFSRRLHECLLVGRRDGWTWFEAVLAYDNARLPEALIRGGALIGDEQMVADGLAALDWLDRLQTNAAGQFRAVGTDSFNRPYATPLPFDQQPLEAWATVDAALSAHEISGDGRWIETARRAHAWYLGDNDLDLPVATMDDGGCFDGLMSNRVNRNQGAESILAYQFSCVAMATLAKVGVERTRKPARAIK